MAAKNGYVAFFDGLSTLGKIIFCLPVLNFFYGLYRVIKGLGKSNILMVIVGIIWMFCGIVAFWLIDLICTIIYGKPVLFA